MPLKVFAEALRSWTEKQKSEQPIGRKNYFLSDEEFVVLQSFVDATKALLARSVCMSQSSNLVQSHAIDIQHCLFTYNAEFLSQNFPGICLMHNILILQCIFIVLGIRSGG